METMPEPKTLQEAVVYFSDPDRCFEFAKKLRWPDGNVVCPRCSAGKNSFVKTRKLWFCYACKKQFTIKVKTIFEDSPLGLDKWMVAFWMLANSKNGISSHELGRTLGITQTSAWFMLQRIRRVLQEKTFVKFGGPGSEVEVDETFIGGKARNMHLDRRRRAIKGTGGYDKTIVVGFLERGKKVRSMIVPERQREIMQQEVRNHVAAETALFTDSHSAYHGLAPEYAHEVVDHAERYVRGNVHTNGLENFWSLLKRGLHGTYVSVEPFHLYRYLDEQAFRFNTRKDNDGNKITDAARFTEAMSRVCGQRLTYSQLTGKDESPRHETTGTGEAQQMPF